MNKISNRQVMCNVLMKAVTKDKQLCVLTSDSRGSASLTEFTKQYPENSIETGIAEQNIVSIAAGLAHSGKRPFVASPACFLSMRSIEQVKVDVAYSNTNVKLVGISGGVSYGALGMSHHSAQDFAVTRAIPNLEVLCPADRFETEAMFDYLTKSDKPAYIRLGRNPVEDVYDEIPEFKIGKAVELIKGKKIIIVAIGDPVGLALKVAEKLKKDNIQVTVINMPSIKPFDDRYFKKNLPEYDQLISLEEHSIYGGLGSALSEIISKNKISIKHELIALADCPTICGTAAEIFEDNGLSIENIVKIVKEGVD
ncbi:MAG: transketolase family protein [Lactovum sp.]